MDPSKKLKAEAKDLGISGYWRYSKEKLLELVAAKKPKDAQDKPEEATKPSVKPSAKPEVKAASVSPKPPSPSKGNKAKILKHIATCNKLIEAERKLIKGPKSVYHYSMLDRSLVSLKDVTTYLAKIQ